MGKLGNKLSPLKLPQPTEAIKKVILKELYSVLQSHNCIITTDTQNSQIQTPHSNRAIIIKIT
jgi:hypothetical protein